MSSSPAAHAPLSYIDVDGHLRPTRNSAGHLIHASEDGIRNFWRWFGNSTAVDAHGKPLLLLHGTAAEFTAFSNDSEVKGSMGRSVGFYFTDNLIAANDYAATGQILPVYIKLSAPMEFSTSMANRADVSARLGIDMDKVYGAPDRAEVYWFFKNGGAYDGRESARVGDTVIAAAREKGYDGAVFKERIDGVTATVFMTFDASQIKSALGNSGAFKPDSLHFCDHTEPMLLDASATDTPTVMVDGVHRPTTNSANQRIHATDAGICNFWRWYKDSELVDEQGRPTVYFRGQNESFNDCPLHERYFTSDHSEAATYGGDSYFDDGDQQNILPVYINATRVQREENINRVTDYDWAGEKQESLLSQGYDAISDTRLGVMVALKSASQIKSAIGNSGAFDPHSSSLCDEISSPICNPSASKLSALDASLHPTTNLSGALYAAP